MSRAVSSSRFNLGPQDLDSDYKVKKADSKQQLVYGSKKMRNQANCTQYFVKNDMSKPKMAGDASKSVIIDKERTKTLKKSIARGALIPSESEFYEKVSRQLAGKLSHAKERSPLRELSRQNEFHDLVRTVRVVDDDLSRKSLGTLAEEVSYVPKLVSREDSSHKKQFSNSSKQEDLHLTKPFTRFDPYESKTQQISRGLKPEWERSHGPITLKPALDEKQRPVIRGPHSSSALDVRQSLSKRSLLRASPPDIASNQSAGQAKKWDFIEDMENKIEEALERSRSRGKLIDFTHGMDSSLGPYIRHEGPLSKDSTSKDGGERPTSLNKTSESSYHKYGYPNNREQSTNSRDNTRSAIDIRDVGPARLSASDLNLNDKGHSSNLNSNSDNKFFQPRASLQKSSNEISLRHASTPSGAKKEPSLTNETENKSNLEQILEDIRPEYIYDYALSSQQGSKNSSPLRDSQQGIDIGNFTSFKDMERNHNPIQTYDYAPTELASQKENSPLSYSPDQKDSFARRPYPSDSGFHQMGSFSGVNPRSECFAIEDLSTPSLTPGLRGSLEWSNRVAKKGENTPQAGPGEPSTSRQMPVELNSNFCKRFWSLRFTSSQELKVLVAESIIFIGDKKNGLKCGKGKFITERSGVVLYEGQFYDNLYHGFGKLTNPKVCEVLSPQWYLNLDEVEGWLKYEGYFAGGLPEGFGSLHMRNGDILKGKFVRGRATGGAAIFSSSGTQKLSGEWVDNQLISMNS
jgi:hypothetical protein